MITSKKKNIEEFLSSNGIKHYTVTLKEEPEALTIEVPRDDILKVYDLFSQNDRLSFFCFEIKASNFKMASRGRGRKKSKQGDIEWDH